MDVGTCWRAQVTAWLLPLPPGIMVKDLPTTVSPGRGNLAAWAVRSIARLPTTTTRAIRCPYVSRRNSSHCSSIVSLTLRLRRVAASSRAAMAASVVFRRWAETSWDVSRSR